jgi:hypothetical protein
MKGSLNLEGANTEEVTFVEEEATSVEEKGTAEEQVQDSQQQRRKRNVIHVTQLNTSQEIVQIESNYSRLYNCCCISCSCSRQDYIVFLINLQANILLFFRGLIDINEYDTDRKVKKGDLKGKEIKRNNQININGNYWNGKDKMQTKEKGVFRDIRFRWR